MSRGVRFRFPYDFRKVFNVIWKVSLKDCSSNIKQLFEKLKYLYSMCEKNKLRQSAECMTDGKPQMIDY